MYLTVHASAGILIGSQTGNPLLAFIVGVLSHYLLDSIPHDSIEGHDWHEKGDMVKKFALEASIDFCVLLGMIVFLQEKDLLILSSPIVWGIIGAVIIDFIWGGIELFKLKGKVFSWFIDIHEGVHAFFYKKQYIPLRYAALIQLLTLAILVGIYLFIRS